MSLLINLRGPNGSGKTTAMREFMALRHPTPLYGEPRVGITGKPLPPKIDGYQLDDNVRVLGSYENECGGCDTMQSQDYVRDVIRAWAKEGHNVLFEGVMISTTWSTWEVFCREQQELGHTFIWAFLQTPLDVCVARVYQRNGGKPINEHAVSDKWKLNQSSIRKSDNDAYKTALIEDWEHAGAALENIFSWGLEQAGIVKGQLNFASLIRKPVKVRSWI